MLHADLASLEEVTGDMTIRNTTLSALDLSTLQSIEGSFVFSDNTGLTNLDISSLYTGVTNLKVEDNIDLPDWHLRMIKALWDFGNNPDLEDISLDTLGTVYGFSAFTTTHCWYLVACAHKLRFILFVQGNETLVSVSIWSSSVTAESIVFENNPQHRVFFDGSRSVVATYEYRTILFWHPIHSCTQRYIRSHASQQSSQWLGHHVPRFRTRAAQHKNNGGISTLSSH